MADKGVSCRECSHFDMRGENKDGRAYGMCRAWRFSINEHERLHEERGARSQWQQLSWSP